MAIDRIKGEMPPKMVPSLTLICRPSSIWRITHVSIYRLLCRSFLCFASLLADKVSADWQVSDRDLLRHIEEDTGSMSSDVFFIGSDVEFMSQMSYVLGYENGGSFGVSPLRGSGNIVNSSLYVENEPIIDAINSIRVFTSVPAVRRRYDNSPYEATLYGLINGFNPYPVTTGTNGIYSFTKNVSDALTDTNSVFHRQLTAQETITNQLNDLVENIHLLSYQLTGLTLNRTDEPLPSYTYYTNYLAQERLSGMQQYQWFNNSHVFDLVALLSIFDQSYLYEHDNSFWCLANDYMGNWNLDYDSEYNVIGSVIGDLSEQLYQRYGNQGQILTNLFDIGTGRQQEDNFEYGIDSASDYFEAEVPQYESLQDSRIKTDFLVDAEDEFTSTTFTKNIYANFKESFKTFMVFDGDRGINYEFSLTYPSDGSSIAIEVEDVNLLESSQSILAQKKPTVDFFIRIILRITQAACYSYLAIGAFKRVNEVFST